MDMVVPQRSKAAFLCNPLPSGKVQVVHCEEMDWAEPRKDKNVWIGMRIAWVRIDGQDAAIFYAYDRKPRGLKQG